MGFRGDIGDLGLADLRPTCESFGSKQTVHEGFRDHYDNRSNLGCSFHRVSPSYSTHTYIGIHVVHKNSWPLMQPFNVCLGSSSSGSLFGSLFDAVLVFPWKKDRFSSLYQCYAI